MGLFQPFSDALKLFSKNINYLYKINELYWNISPILTFIVLLLILNFIPLIIEINNIINNNIIIIIIIGLPIYTLFFRSFFSFRKFSLIRSKRCITQILSYEIGLIYVLILLIPLLIKSNIEEILKILNISRFSNFFLIILIIIIVIRESRRIPFDFIERESELVSGFNTEYSRSFFSLFFIYEYGIIIYLRILIRIIIINFFLSLVIIYIFIHLRSSFPRFRYDQIINFTWKLLYPLLFSLFRFIKFF